MGKKQVQIQQEIAKCPKKNQIKTFRNRIENRPLTSEQVRMLMLGVDNLRDCVLLHLGFNTGMRVSEVLTFSQDAIDWQQGSIRIWDAKKNEYRLVYPPLESLNKLKQWITESRPMGNPVFSHNAKTSQRIIQKWTKKTLGEKRSWHSIRHTYINLSAELEQDIKVVCQNTGDSIATILQYYRKPSPGYLRKKVEEKPIYQEKA